MHDSCMIHATETLTHDSCMINACLAYVHVQVGWGMTKNGLRYPCFCNQCEGETRDYRTVLKHQKRMAADQPLFPAELADNFLDPLQFEPAVDENDMHVPRPNVPDMPYPEVMVEDKVSRVESLENCNEPAYETVHKTITHKRYLYI
jgi:hypothetical protein